MLLRTPSVRAMTPVETNPFAAALLAANRVAASTVSVTSPDGTHAEAASPPRSAPISPAVGARPRWVSRRRSRSRARFSRTPIVLTGQRSRSAAS